MIINGVLIENIFEKIQQYDWYYNNQKPILYFHNELKICNKKDESSIDNTI